jgi:hypothetical protein
MLDLAYIFDLGLFELPPPKCTVYNDQDWFVRSDLPPWLHKGRDSSPRVIGRAPGGSHGNGACSPRLLPEEPDVKFVDMLHDSCRPRQAFVLPSGGLIPCGSTRTSSTS